MPENLSEVQPSERSRLVLSSRLSAHEAESLFVQIQEISGQDIEIVASGVESVSTPCIQVLMAAANAWRLAGKSMEITNPSPALAEAAERLAIDPASLQSKEIAA